MTDIKKSEKFIKGSKEISSTTDTVVKKAGRFGNASSSLIADSLRKRGINLGEDIVHMSKDKQID
jgi:hypothetical protein